VADLPAKVSQATGKMSISGVQIKASIRLSEDGKMFEIVSEGGTHILKPAPTEYPELPENENLVMNMAHELKMNVPPHGLFRMADGKLCYIIKRFDRLPGGKKIHKEDMAQLLMLPADRKYSSSLEAIGNVISVHTSEPRLELYDYFQRIIFNFIVGNGDMHLKNWSLITPAGGGNRLAPCYDFVCSKMYIDGEEDFALPIGGRKNGLNLKDFMRFALRFEMDEKVAENAIGSILRLKPKFIEMIRDSFLSEERKAKLVKILEERIQQLI